MSKVARRSAPRLEHGTRVRLEGEGATAYRDGFRGTGFWPPSAICAGGCPTRMVAPALWCLSVLHSRSLQSPFLLRAAPIFDIGRCCCFNAVSTAEEVIADFNTVPITLGAMAGSHIQSCQRYAVRLHFAGRSLLEIIYATSSPCLDRLRIRNLLSDNVKILRQYWQAISRSVKLSSLSLHLTPAITFSPSQ